MGKNINNQICPNCGQEFVCDIKTGEDKCWCMNYPQVISVPNSNSKCFCPNCIKAEISKLNQSKI
jgi:hypothetical protein